MDAKQQPTSLSPCDTEKLKRCLEDHEGDASKCSHLISAFKSSCGKQQQKTEEALIQSSASPSSATEQAVAVNNLTPPTAEK